MKFWYAVLKITATYYLLLNFSINFINYAHQCVAGELMMEEGEASICTS
jgi:hypothetical protein